MGATLFKLFTDGAFTVFLIGIAKILLDIWERRKDRGQARITRLLNEMDVQYSEMSEKMTNLRKDIEANKETATQTELVLLHDRIWQIYRALKDRDEITVEEEANLDYLYAEYKKKGGNHKARSMYRFLKKKKVISGDLVDEEDEEDDEWEDFLK